jgi:hypothetical protein
MDVVFAAAADAFMQGSFSWDPHPALAYEQTRVYVSGNTLQIAGSRVCEETRRESQECWVGRQYRRDEKQQQQQQQQQHAALAALQRGMQTLDDARQCM